VVGSTSGKDEDTPLISKCVDSQYSVSRLGILALMQQLFTLSLFMKERILYLANSGKIRNFGQSLRNPTYEYGLYAVPYSSHAGYTHN
jgi:hypothetical protein